MVVKDLDIVVLIADVTDYDIVSSTVITVPAGMQATCISNYGDIGLVMVEGCGEDHHFILDVPTAALTVIGSHITT